MSEPVLVLNCGSSSIKFAVFEASVEPLPRKPLWSGKVEGIGSKNPTLVDGNTAPLAVALDAEASYHAALQRVRACVERQTGGRPQAVVAHRVVHGGSNYTAPVRVDARVLSDLKSYIPLAPTISRPTSRLRVAVEPTNEEWMAARQALAALRRADAAMPASNRASAEAMNERALHPHDAKR